MRRAPVISMLSFAAALGVSACFAPNEGVSPNPDSIYFPVGIALGPSDGANGPKRMYVANSDFDLQYNAGSVQAFDLDKIQFLVEKKVPKVGEESQHCADLGTGVREQTLAEQITVPAPCTAVDPSDLIVDSVLVGAFATDVLFSARPADAPAGATGRLFVPVRGDTTLHWIDVDETKTAGSLQCGQDSDGACDHDHRRGGDPAEENTRGVQLPPEPFGVAANEDGRVVVLTHQSDGKVSLFTNEWSNVGPNLQFVAGGTSSDPPGALAIANIPKPAYLTYQEKQGNCTPYEPSFLLSFRNAAQVRLVRYFSDGYNNDSCTTGQNQPVDPARPFLDMTQSAPISTNSLGFNSRGIAVDATKRQDCESACDSKSSTYGDCLHQCAYIGLDVYVANRTPASLILGQTQSNLSELGTSDIPTFNRPVGLLAGPSRVIAGAVKGVDGQPARRIFIVCFDSRVIYVYDPVAGRVETEIHTGRGPHAFAVDPARGLGYIGHFTDSYIGVVDLNLQHTSAFSGSADTYGKLRLTIGAPTRPRAAK